MTDPNLENVFDFSGFFYESVVSDMEDSIKAIIVVGSLATKSYLPEVSDIDQITILKDSTTPEAPERVLQHIYDTMESFGRSVNLSTVVYRLSDLKRPRRTDHEYTPETKHLLSIPEELLRIHDHGKVIYGKKEIILELPKPAMEEITDCKKLVRKWDRKIRKTHPEIERMVKNPTVKIAVQSILSNAIWHYYYTTGRTCFNKHQIAHKLKEKVPGYIFQDVVELATKIRMNGFRDISDRNENLLIKGYHNLLQWGKDHPVNAVPI